MFKSCDTVSRSGGLEACPVWALRRDLKVISIKLATRLQASQVALVVKNPPATAGDIRDAGSIPGSDRSPGGGHGNPLQYSCLENPMDRGAWQATAHRVAKSQTRLSD